jgi:hypothetical protein
MLRNLLAEGDPDYSTLPKEDTGDAKKAYKMALDLLDAKDLLLDGHILLEKKIEVLGMPEIFGTVDLIGFNPAQKHLLILDYKFGYGEVLAQMNPQLLIYALGARRIFAKTGIDTITLAIIQPQRSDKPLLFTLSNKELNEWNNEVLLPAYEGINRKEMTFCIDDTACRWCPSKLDCPARLQEIDDVFLANDIEDKGYDSVFDKLQMVARMRDWCNTVEAEAERLLKEGVTDPRWKLVQGKANRRWKDEEEAAKWLAARGLKEKERFTFKVIGIPAAETLVKPLITDSVKLQNAFGRLIEEPEGRITYAPSSDKRPGVEIKKVETMVAEFDNDLDSL